MIRKETHRPLHEIQDLLSGRSPGPTFFNFSIGEVVGRTHVKFLLSVPPHHEMTVGHPRVKFDPLLPEFVR